MTERLRLTDQDDFVLTINDVRAAGYCPKGVRRWFEGGNAAGKHFDFRDFLQNGRSAKELLETGDALAEQCVRRALEARGHG